MQVDEKERDPKWDPESTAAYWINRASRLLLRLHEARLRPLGFGMGQLPVLMALEDGAMLPQKALAERAHVEQPTMAEMLARMEKLGIVERSPNPDDKRGSLTSLTKKARARLPQAKAALLQGERDATRDLKKKERALLVELLQRVVKALEEGDAGEGG